MVGSCNYNEIIAIVLGENLSWQTEMKVQKVHYQIMASRKLKQIREMERDVTWQAMQWINEMIYRPF